MAGDGAAGNDQRNAVRARSAEGHCLRVRDFSAADLDGVDPHFGAFVLVAVAEEDGGGEEGAAGGVEALVGGPVVLLDAVDELGDDGRVGRLVIGGDDAVPFAGGEGAVAEVAVAALAEVVALPEQVAIGGVVERVHLQERGRAAAMDVHQDVIDQRELVDLGAAAVGLDAVVHHVADVAVEVAGHFHDLGRLAVDVRHPQIRRGPELRREVHPETVHSSLPVEILQRLAHRGRQVTFIEIPLAGHRRAGGAADQNAKGPRTGMLDSERIRELQPDQIILGGTGRVRREGNRGLSVQLA